MTTIITIDPDDGISSSRTDLNTNFANLNSDKIESSYLDTDTTLSANSDTKIATQKAVKAYIDAGGNPFASETQAGIVEEATDAEVSAGTSTGSTGAKLFITPEKLSTFGVGKIANIQTFTSSGTWTKPSGNPKKVFIQTWGGGGSGAKGNVAGGGGGGGAYSDGFFDISQLGATETVTIGDGGAAVSSPGAGNTGGTTTFGTLVKAYGGGGGGSGTTVGGGGGGGQFSAGGTGGVTGTAGTAGSPGSPLNAAGNSGVGFYSGGGAASSGGLAGGDSIYGGAGGGNSAATAGGVSRLGGNGGAGHATNGVAGSVPGGGGGAIPNTGTASGAGGKGKCIVTTFF